MNYSDWEKAVPEAITSDSLWKMKAYRLALLLGDLAWHDVTKLMQDRRTLNLASQLYEAVGSIGANVAEGYSRGTGKDRARFYEYALGSARESRDWYFKGRHVLGEAIVEHRLQLLAEILRLLLTMIPDQRKHAIREESGVYEVTSGDFEENADVDWSALNDLLQDMPLP
ncbi:MAG TPA: four helix bundle protein [Anaerolineae bacterium]